MLYSVRLKQLRERNGITQAKAGSLINLDSGTYCHYENEEIIIPIKHLNTLANFYNVSIDYLFEFTDNANYNKMNHDIDPIRSGERLKEFRKNNKITQSKLANLLNTVQPVIANYEKGKHLIATPFLYTICSKYHISADYLLGKSDKPKYFK